MAIISRLSQWRRLRRSADGALLANLPQLRASIAGLPLPAAHTNARPLDLTHLEDLWPAIMRHRDTDPQAVIALDREFHWIADVAGRKLYQLDQAEVGESQRVAERARIIDEARAFAAMAVQAAVRGLHTGSPDLDTTTPPLAPTSDALAAPGGDNYPRPEGNRERLERLLVYVARQEPRIAWVVGDRPDGTTVLATDLAHGWIPPRIALPDGVDILPPGAWAGAVPRDLLGDVVEFAEYSPGSAFPAPHHDWPATASSPAPRQGPPVADLVGLLADHAAKRVDLPPAVRALARSAARGSAIVPRGLLAIHAHVDAARHQLLSDYPLVDHSVRGDCMLLAAIEGYVTGDKLCATYHYAWFDALNDLE
ncbi:hypothetical protein MycrhDRAFT_5481 [Mycolicibacterium rhodesiae JS60]|nr:hypothetical protein MycrhDRAFT_5481 [Mycolicibacterium rhodesiae JS60]